METIGPRLRETRRANGVSQESLAEKTGVAVTTIIRIEQGRAKPKFETIWKFAEALGVDPKQLAYGDGDEIGEKSESEAAFYDRVAEDFRTGARDMVNRLRQLEDLESLSVKDRALIKREIPKFERLAQTFDRLRQKQ
jgi:transcriptional regulator with XRE-family HTH domain